MPRLAIIAITRCTIHQYCSLIVRLHCLNDSANSINRNRFGIVIGNYFRNRGIPKYSKLGTNIARRRIVYHAYATLKLSLDL